MRPHLLDTNVILCFLTQEPKHQAQQATQFFEQCERGGIPLKVSPMVIAELVFVLTGEAYQLPRKVVAEQLEIFLESPSFQVEELETILLALKVFSQGKIDFVDAYLKAMAELMDYSLTSFDQGLGRSRDLTFSKFSKIRAMKDNS